MTERLSMDDYSDIWDGFIARLHEDYSQSFIDLWFADVRLLSLTDSRALICCKNEFKRSILSTKYKGVVENTLAEILGFPVEVLVTTNDKNTTPPPPPVGQNPVEEHELLPGQVTVEQYSDSAPDKNTSDATQRFLNGTMSHYTFENFIVGSSNKFAHAACRAVAQSDSSEYNPLLIYGDSGLGKTHLLYAITNEITRRRPNVKIIYVKGDDFTNQMIDSISRNCTGQFRDKYRKADVLLIDDIQFIAGKVATQEEFFHTFNALYEDHKQIIMTSDRPPREMRHLEDRIRTRMEGGLIADVQSPDYELRCGILKSKAESFHIDLPDDVLHFLAENLRNNVRQLEGAIKKLGAQSMLTGAPITMDLAITCIADMIKGSEPVSVTVDRILNKVSKKYGVSPEMLKGRSRKKDIALARHVSVYLIRSLTGMSLPNIGAVMGGRDHTTVLSSLDFIANNIKNNSLFEIEIKELEREIKTNPFD